QAVALSESLARRLFGPENPIGRRVDMGQDRGLEVVGIANSASLWSAREAEPLAVYLPLLQAPGQANPMLDVRTARRDAGLAGAVRDAIESLGRHYPMRLETIEDRAEAVFAQERMMCDVASFLGAIALLLSAVGIYGATAYSVARRSDEIAVRMAVGARPGDVMRLVLGQTATVIGAGVIAGVPAAVGALRLASASVFGLSEGGSAGIALAVAMLAAAAFGAAWLPAMRAANADPAAALRSDR